MRFNRYKMSVRKGLIGVFASCLLSGAALISAKAGDVSNDVNFTQDVVYQIMTDRFEDGDSGNNPTGSLFSSGCSNLVKYCGGDWEGIVDRIEDGYLTDMGITALWISQPVENVYAVVPGSGMTSYHGFWARDYKKTNPYFGSMSDFEDLISSAHSNGIKVIIDFAPNHTSPSSDVDPDYMEDGVLKDDGSFVASLNSDSGGVFNHNGGTDFSTYEDGIYRGLFDLADYNLQNSTIDAYMKSAINLWLDKGVDGIRVDAVKHMPPGWSKVWVDSVYSHRSVFMFGEWFLGGSEVDPLNEDYANESGMSLLDFRFGNAIRAVLRDSTADWYDFDDMIGDTDLAYNEVIDQVTFIDNHDMPRYHYTSADTRRTDMALAVTLTSRGTPVVYYGTEQYMTGTGDPSNRGFMTSFSKTTTGYQIIAKLAAVRQDNPALGYGDTEERWINSNIYIYEREYGDNVVLVAINRATSGSTSITGLYTSLPSGTYSDELDGLLDGNSITVNSNGSVNAFDLGAGEVAVWQKTSAGSTPIIGHVGPMSARSGQTLTIDGEGFGTSTGTVYFDTSSGTIVSWSDDQVKVQVPSMTPGYYDVTVKTNGNVTSDAYDQFEVLTAAQVSVRFIVNSAYTSMGQNVYLTGNIHELSFWSATSSASVGPFFNQVVEQYPTWYYDVSVPAGQSIEYKYVKIDGSGNVTWESGNNHTYTAPSSGTGEAEVTWQ